jgi:DNA-binding transcriptional LysR family regulator
MRGITLNYNDLDLNLIKTFLVVYETRSILHASKKLYVSQPAVSNSIKRLETFLNGQLFVRTPKGVIPTVEGEQFNNHCHNAMKIMNNGINNFSLYGELKRGTINIGSSSTIIRKILLPYIEEFTKKYPNINISVVDAHSSKLVRLVKRGEVDLAILNTPIEDEGVFNMTKIKSTTDCFIASAKFEKNFLTKEELKTQALILQKRPSNNRDYFEKMCFLNNVHFEPKYEIGSFGLITDFVEKNMGIGYVVKDFIKEDLEKGRIRQVDTDFEILPRDVVVITLQDSTNSLACKSFISEMVHYLKK